MSDKTRTYVFIGLGVLVLILLVIVVLTYMGGNTTTAGGAGAAAVAAVAAAAKVRMDARAAVDEGEKEIEKATGEIADRTADAETEMAHNEANTPNLTPDEKVALGNDLLNPDKPEGTG